MILVFFPLNNHSIYGLYEPKVPSWTIFKSQIVTMSNKLQFESLQFKSIEAWGPFFCPSATDIYKRRLQTPEPLFYISEITHDSDGRTCLWILKKHTKGFKNPSRTQ